MKGWVLGNLGFIIYLMKGGVLGEPWFHNLFNERRGLRGTLVP